MGCWNDKTVRAIPTLENTWDRRIDDRIEDILDGDARTREYAVEKCAAAAELLGYKVFAIQAGGQCFSSENAADTYYKYGKSTICNPNGTGDKWVNNVYYFKKGKYSATYKTH